jgi:S1-C subfamily serine protease
MTLTFLFSCQSLNNNNKENIFESHLSNYKDVYLERIAYFNELSQTHIASSVKIRTFGTKFTTGTGSGVIYKKTDTHYFVLTNQHVIADDLIEETV